MRIKVENLPAREEQLEDNEMKSVSGGAIVEPDASMFKVSVETVNARSTYGLIRPDDGGKWSVDTAQRPEGGGEWSVRPEGGGEW